MTQSSGAPSVRADATTLSARVDQGRLEFTVPLVITNGTGELIQYEPCGAVLERSVQGQWMQVWGATCALQTRPPIDVQPGAAVRSDVLVSASTRLGGAQTWPDNAVEGEYRMRVLLARPSDGVFAPPFNTSNAFAVRVQR
jgi:hypothetical protein